MIRLLAAARRPSSPSSLLSLGDGAGGCSRASPGAFFLVLRCRCSWSLAVSAAVTSPVAARRGSRTRVGLICVPAAAAPGVPDDVERVLQLVVGILGQPDARHVQRRRLLRIAERLIRSYEGDGDGLDRILARRLPNLVRGGWVDFDATPTLRLRPKGRVIAVGTLAAFKFVLARHGRRHQVGDAGSTSLIAVVASAVAARRWRSRIAAALRPRGNIYVTIVAVALAHRATGRSSAIGWSFGRPLDARRAGCSSSLHPPGARAASVSLHDAAGPIGHPADSGRSCRAGAGRRAVDRRRSTARYGVRDDDRVAARISWPTDGFSRSLRTARSSCSREACGSAGSSPAGGDCSGSPSAN